MPFLAPPFAHFSAIHPISGDLLSQQKGSLGCQPHSINREETNQTHPDPLGNPGELFWWQSAVHDRLYAAAPGVYQHSNPPNEIITMVMDVFCEQFQTFWHCG